MALDLFQYGTPIRDINELKFHELVYWNKFLKKIRNASKKNDWLFC